MRFDVLLSTVLLLMMITYASAIGEIAQTYVGGNDATELVRAFNDWIDENGAKSWSKVVVKEFPGMFCLTLISTNKHTQTQQNKHTHTHTPAYRLGLVARENIEADDVYLSIPWKLVISEDKFAESKHARIFQKLETDHGFDTSLRLATFLFYEKQKKEASFWKPFIDLLPATFNVPLVWDEQDLKELKGTGVYADALKWNDDTNEKYKLFKKFLKTKSARKMFDKTFVKEFQREDFVWAYAVLDSRTIWIDGRYRCFTPILDMANGKNHPTRKHHTSRDPKTGSTMTRAIWSVEEGEQLFENYATPNAQNLLYHGFILKENSFDSVEFYMRPARDVMQNKPFLLPALRKFELRPMYKLQLGSIPKGLMTLARVLSIENEEEASKAIEVDIYESRLSLENERRALQMMITECGHILKTQYLTSTIEEDEALLTSSSLSSNRKTSISFRLQQKRIFADVQHRAQTLLNGLNEDGREL